MMQTTAVGSNGFNARESMNSMMGSSSKPLRYSTISPYQ